MSSTVCVKDTQYRVIETEETVEGIKVLMYGVVGIRGNETVVITGLSESSARIKKLVDKMNDGGLQLCQLRDVVEDFLSDSYGMVII
jgi:hypothetical protein